MYCYSCCWRHELLTWHPRPSTRLWRNFIYSKTAERNALLFKIKQLVRRVIIIALEAGCSNKLPDGSKAFFVKAYRKFERMFHKRAEEEWC